jgi:hypothetical protein
MDRSERLFMQTIYRKGIAMNQFVWLILCGLSVGACCAGCQSGRGCPSGSCRTPQYSSPTYAPTTNAAAAESSGYPSTVSPYPSSTSPGPTGGSETRSAPTYQGSGSR